VKNKYTDNSRNGHSKKTLRTSMGKVEINVPRDRNGEFEPQLIRKNQTSILRNTEKRSSRCMAKCISTSDIEEHIRDIYGLNVSDSTVSRITDKILPEAKEWQQRPLESVYATVDEISAHDELDEFAEKWDRPPSRPEQNLCSA
jgi:transposase-like protein